MPPPLYRRVLGARFDALDEAVRRLHACDGDWRCPGRCTIEPASGFPARVLARLLGLPHGHADADFGFELRVDGDDEVWTRHFPQRAMRSRLSGTAPGLLDERLGPARLGFRLEVDDGALAMHLTNIHLFGLRWPRRWFPRVHAREHGEGTRFHFDIDVHLGPLGRLVAYRGHLDLDRAEAIA